MQQLEQCMKRNERVYLAQPAMAEGLSADLLPQPTINKGFVVSSL